MTNDTPVPFPNTVEVRYLLNHDITQFHNLVDLVVVVEGRLTGRQGFLT